MRLHWQILAASIFLTASPSIGEAAGKAQSPGQEVNSGQGGSSAKARVAEDDELRTQEADTDLLALMSGRCSTLSVAGHDFACKTVAYAHGTRGRAYFT